jgi:hypothetical protein
MMPGGPGMGQGMGPGMGVSQNPPFERMGGMIQFIGHMGDALFNPQIAGMIAVGGLKDEMRAKPEDKIKFFEAQLEKTKSLGLRNAIRMVLKDLYKAQSDDAKAMDQLKAMLEENAAAAQQMQSQTKPPAK